MADARFSVDYGKRVAKCQMSKCKKSIDKGLVRIAKIVKSPFSDDGDMKQFHHPACLFDAFKRARATTKVIEDPTDIEGWKDIKDEDKACIITLIKGLEEFRAANGNKTTPKKGKGAKVASPAKGPSSPKTLSPAKDVEPLDWELIAGKGCQKDDTFREFRRLCASVAEEAGHNAKMEIFKKFLRKGTDGQQFKGHLLTWTKLLLPGVIKRVYNVQSKQLVKIFSKIFSINEDEMLTDLEQGDVAETIAKFFEKSKTKVKSAAKSRLSVLDVDGYLQSLTALTKENDQIASFSGFVIHCTTNDLKMLIRIIKGDLRMGAGAKPVLEALHKDAYEKFNSSRNINAIIDQVIGLRKSQGSSNIDNQCLDVGATLMMPIQPMLAAPCKSIEGAFDKCREWNLF